MNVWFVQFRKCHDLRDSAGRSFSCKNGNISTENSYFQHFQIEFCPKILHSAAWHHNQLCLDLDLIYEIHFRLFYPQFHSIWSNIYYSPLLPAEINSTQGFNTFSIFIWSSIISDNKVVADVIVHEDIFIFGSELGEFDIFYKFGNFVFFAKFEELSCFWISNKEDFSSFGREGKIQGPCEYHWSLKKNIETILTSDQTVNAFSYTCKTKFLKVQSGEGNIGSRDQICLILIWTSSFSSQPISFIT